MNHESYNDRFAGWLQSQMEASGHTIARVAVTTDLSKTTIVGLMRGLLPITADIRQSLERHFGAFFESEEPQPESGRSMDVYMDAPGYVLCQRGHLMSLDSAACHCGSSEALY